MTPVRTKLDMYRRLLAGEFGNTMQVFDSLNHALASGVTPLGVRSLNPSDPIRIYWCPRLKLRRELERAGASYRKDLVFYSTDYGLESDRIVQGELKRDERGLCFYYSRLHFPMRIALEKDGRQTYGLTAEMTLRHFVRDNDPDGYDWLLHLLDEYRDHVVEFTTYRRRVGTHPAKTLIWECRLY